MDNNLLQTGSGEYSHLTENISDEILLTDTGEKVSKQVVMDSSLDELDEGFIDIQNVDDEINSMVKESIEDQEITSSETALEELEDLSLQMESLEAEEDELR